MNSLSPTSILICGDVGQASQALLRRGDLRIRLALTVREAESVVRWTQCGVCLMTEALARPVLAACKQSGRPITSVVLLDGDGWQRWKEYFAAGATSLLQASATERIFDAVADATGLSFRIAPRVPYETEVSYDSDELDGVALSHNLSASGICLVKCPPMRLGQEVTLSFEVQCEEFSTSAVVAQLLRAEGQPAIGFSFRNMPSDTAARLAKLVEKELRIPGSLLGSGLRWDNDETTRTEFLARSIAPTMPLDFTEELIARGDIAPTDRSAQWLRAACNSMTPVEVASILGQAVPEWAHLAVLGRLRAYQACERAGSDDKPTDEDIQAIEDISSRLAVLAADADEASLVLVTELRAGLFHALYDPSVQLET